MLNSDSIKDKELREAAKEAEAAFRENNSLPIINQTGQDETIDQTLNRVNALRNLQKTVSNSQKLKHFAYKDNDTLIQQIQNLYPDSTNILIINNDRRDGLGVPTFTTRQLRQRFSNVTWSYGKRVVNSLEYNAYQIVVCLVENGLVHCKIMVNSELRNLEY